MDVRLDDAECRRRLLEADHGVLATRHPERGVDAVPVCFAVVGDRLAVPVDRVKPKATTTLRRAANLDADPRAVLLVEQWDRHDWARLWWVQAHLERVAAGAGRDLESAHAGRDLEAAEATRDLEATLAARYAQYRADGAIAGLIVFGVRRLAGWAGADSPA